MCYINIISILKGHTNEFNHLHSECPMSRVFKIIALLAVLIIDPAAQCSLNESNRATAQIFNNESPMNGEGSCTDLSYIAMAAMNARQSGIAMSEVWQAAESVRLYQAVVFAAYELPIQPTTALKQAQILHFGNEVFSICVQGYYFDYDQ